MLTKLLRTLFLLAASFMVSYGLVILAHSFQIYSYRRFAILSLWITPGLFMLGFLALREFIWGASCPLLNKEFRRQLAAIGGISLLASWLLVPASTDQIRFALTVLFVALTFLACGLVGLFLWQRQREKYLSVPALTFFALAGVAGFTLFGYMSLHVRMYGDDFCYRNLVILQGYLPAVLGFYLNWSGRLASIFLSFAFTDLFYGVALQLGLIALAGIFTAYFLSAKMENKGLRLLWSLSAAFFIPFLVFALAPDPYKTIFWTVASTDYLPLLFLLPFYFLLLVAALQSRLRHRWFASLAAFLISFLLTNTHEVATLPVIFLNLSLFTLTLHQDRDRTGRVMLLGFTLLGSLAGSAVTILSPGNFSRQVSQAYLGSPGPIETLRLTSVYFLEYLGGTFTSPSWILLLTAFFIGLLGPKLAGPVSGDKPGVYPWLALALSLVMAWLAFIPGVYAAQAQIPPRAQFIPTLFLVYGFLAAGFLSQCLSCRWLMMATLAIVLFVCLFYSPAVISQKMALVQPLIRYAQDWDERDQLLRHTPAGSYPISIPWDEVEQEFYCLVDYYNFVRKP